MTIFSGGPAPTPPVARIHDLVHRAAAQYGDGPFVADMSAGHWSGWSFRAASEAVRAFAAVLASRGVRAGDPVALQSENRPEWGLVYLAILEAGAVVVPLDAQLEEGDTGEILATSDARIVVASGAQHDKVARAGAARGLLLEIVPIEEVARPHAKTVESESPASAAPPSRQRAMNVIESITVVRDATAVVATRDVTAVRDATAVVATRDVTAVSMPRDARDQASADPSHPELLAALLFTSGTTGSAKAVMLTHASILANVEACVAAFHFGDGDRFLSVLPQHHAFECTAGFLAPLRSGASIAYARSLKSNELREDLETSRATIMLGVPLLYEKLLAAITRGIESAPPSTRALARAMILLSRAWRRVTGSNAARLLCAPLRRRAGLSRLRMLVSGAAPLRAEVFEGFSQVGLLLLEGYGLTECAPVVTANRPERAVPGSVGWPLPGVEVRIFEPGADGIGEVVIRGPNVMRGYFRNPQATASVLREGWFHSGDLGRIGTDGRLVLTGRIRNLIVTAAGKKVYPEEVEANLAKSPFVREVAVVAGHGAYESRAREEVHAHVVPELEAIEPAARALGRSADEAFVRETLEREVERLGRDLAPFKRVRKLIIRTEELPKTTTGKVRRDTLR